MDQISVHEGTPAPNDFFVASGYPGKPGHVDVAEWLFEHGPWSEPDATTSPAESPGFVETIARLRWMQRTGGTEGGWVAEKQAAKERAFLNRVVTEAEELRAFARARRDVWASVAAVVAMADDYSDLFLALDGLDRDARLESLTARWGHERALRLEGDEEDAIRVINGWEGGSDLRELARELGAFYERNVAPAIAALETDAVEREAHARTESDARQADREARPLRPKFALGGFRAYSDGAWREISTEKVNTVVQGLNGLEYVGGKGKDGEPVVKSWRLSRSDVEGIADLFHQRAKVGAGGLFDREQSGLAFRNGYLSVDAAGRALLLDHSPAWANVHAFDFDLPLREPSAPMFMAYLRECLADHEQPEIAERTILAYIGLSLLGRATETQAAILLHGPGKTGKSTLLTIIARLFPTDSVASIEPQDLAGDNKKVFMAELAGKRLNVAFDIHHSTLQRSGTLKSIIAGDAGLTAKRLYAAPFVFTPRAGTAISCNTLPTTADTTDAFWRRWIVIPFRRPVPSSKVRPKLAEEILASERAEIVALAIDHALVALRNGCQLEISTDSARAIDQWREDADTILAYARAHLDADETARTPGRHLYAHYRNEAEASGQKPLGETNFRRRLTELGFKSRRVASGVVWQATIRSGDRKTLLSVPGRSVSAGGPVEGGLMSWPTSQNTSSAERGERQCKTEIANT